MIRREDSYVLAIDQGTSGTSAALYDADVNLIAKQHVAVNSIYPQPGWVEQDPFEIITSIRQAVLRLIESNNLSPGQIECLGFAHQGESLLLWNLETGEPVYNVISWQCTRSSDLCNQMIQEGLGKDFQDLTGLVIDPEWPATKIPWSLDNIDGIRPLIDRKCLAYSQIDAWLMYQLTQERMFLTDYSMASRSGLFNIFTHQWDWRLIQQFKADNIALPEVLSCSDYFGEVNFGGGWKIPWRGNILDQSAALFGHGCFSPGETKITYGTCAGFWINMGQSIKTSTTMDTSIAWEVDRSFTYAASGEIRTAGASLTWLKDRLNMIWTNDRLSEIAESAKGHEDLYFIPAFSGLGAPYWEPKARGVIFGLSAGIGMEHLLRASLEATAFSVRDIFEAFSKEEDVRLPNAIKADGGMAANEYLMQFQADILGKVFLIPQNLEGTSTGTAILAGIHSGYYPNKESFNELWKPQRIYEPKMSAKERERRYKRWKEMVEHTINIYTSK